ncbi:MAG: NAD(+)/NADH kinase [Synergistes sp.]|nr:NAD(+)/NADH kinase [Synergistes sp.]
MPLFGVNMGRVGFLSSVEPDCVYQAIDKMLDGEYWLRDRLLVKAQVSRDEKLFAEYIALNDFVIGSGMFSRAITFDLWIDNEQINSYNADGIIISTPTGSTGYSLSAGGPILMDDMDITLITPVCPHTFFSRPIVANASSKVEIVCNSKASLTVDGQFRLPLIKNDEVKICGADIKAKIIQFANNDYFERIKNKLYRTV